LFLKAELRRAYITELASQFRDEELIVNLKIKGFGMHYEGGFSTDFSESCVWMTPFIKEPGNVLRLM
jgi:hypothetical protein